MIQAKCPLCEGQSVKKFKKVESNFIYKEKALQVKTDVYKCLKCDFEYETDSANEIKDQAILEYTRNGV